MDSELQFPMRIVDVVGARPQFIKLAPVLKAIELHNRKHPERGIEEILAHTGQHYDYEMSQVFFDELGLKAPDYHLGVGSGTHGYQTGEMLKRIEEVFLKEKPDLVVVYGDTNSTLAGALTAAKLHIPVAHVEAGLRSFNRKMPEEINRVLTDHVADLLFCPTETAVQNLKREGFTNIVNDGRLLPHDYARRTPGDKPRTARHVPLVLNVGDVMYDAVLQYAELAEAKSGILERLALEPRCYALATVHRAENTDDPVRLRGIFQGLATLAQEGLTVVVPLHPRTRNALSSLSFTPNYLPRNLLVIEPISYLDMLMLEKNARVILTDSGGVQKEAFFFRVPCVTLREETEWVETVEAGWNVLVGCDPERIVHAALEAQPGKECAWPYGDGQAAERIMNGILFHVRD
ncbi:MAG: UDP-N-acetylglucosamine 2-epimerase (non-hydrolyzing) [Candidatus Bipolaricaulis sibiricus]|uniref:UDP-N-acetylglucosamine 2-epimerase (Non-hydrolyzing) n=1 Tax=Bipolaricaulis sibiricus TaxID=2501609 RepID=A0A410FTU4_BIPS1|nr:MAG: UDP-N-acetylglucosamine 2-epimerase (non-hydrolyzing) [Candidatus Bipolaricaulis sibiricus]